MTADAIGAAITAAGAILLCVAIWPADEFVRDFTLDAGAVLSVVGGVILAFAFGLGPVALVVGLALLWYAWLVRRAYRDRRGLLDFIELTQVRSPGFAWQAWHLGLPGGFDPRYDPNGGGSWKAAESKLTADAAVAVLPEARKQARLRWAVLNAGRLFVMPQRSGKPRPRPLAAEALSRSPARILEPH
jgi:hypothetical protein